MSTAAIVPPLIHISALSAYGLFLSYQNITRLQAYESQAKTAAEWSNTAAQRLHKTRTTQTSGTVTLLLSTLSTLSTYQLLPTTPSILLLAPLLNTAFLGLSSAHMTRFWNSKQTKIPFAEKFNEAVQGSRAVTRLLMNLCVCWGTVGMLWWVGGGLGLGAAVTNGVYFAVAVGCMAVLGA